MRACAFSRSLSGFHGCATSWRNPELFAIDSEDTLASLVVSFGVALAIVATPSAMAEEKVQAAGFDIMIEPGYTISQFAVGFTTPTAMAFAANGDLYVLDSGFGSFRAD